MNIEDELDRFATATSAPTQGRSHLERYNAARAERGRPPLVQAEYERRIALMDEIRDFATTPERRDECRRELMAQDYSHETTKPVPVPTWVRTMASNHRRSAVQRDRTGDEA